MHTVIAGLGSASPFLASVAATCQINGHFAPCQEVNGLGVLGGLFVGLIYLGILILMLFSYWNIYTKAGRPGWASIVPIYNIIVMLQIIGMEEWYVILLLIPLVNIVISIIMVHKLSLVFGHNIGMTIGLLLLPFIFFPILAFGKSKYTGPHRDSSLPPQQPAVLA